MGKRKRDDDRPSSHASSSSTAAPQKLPRLPPGYTVTKRPLLRPPIPSPYSARHQKQIYISASTPFMSAVKRATKLLDKADRRTTQRALDRVRKQRQQRPHYGAGGAASGEGGQAGRGELDEAARLAAATQQHDDDDGRGGEVVLRGTGRAVDRVLNIGAWFAQREGYAVRIKTGSVGAVDDIVEPEEEEEEGGEVAGGEPTAPPLEDQVPSARLRWASTVEVVLSRA